MKQNLCLVASGNARKSRTGCIVKEINQDRKPAFSKLMQQQAGEIFALAMPQQDGMIGAGAEMREDA
jgi:hypothetical protein